MFTESYIVNDYDNDAAKFSGIFDDILKGVNAGLGVFKSVGGLFGIGGGSSSQGCSGQAKGLNAIQTCSTQLLAAMDALGAQVGQQPYEQIISQAQALVNALSNPQFFYQAQRGRDAEVLANAKTQAQQKLQQIIALANAAAQNPIRTGVGQAGQVVSSGGNVVTSGFDSLSEILNDKIVIYGALGLVAYLLVQRKR